MSRLSHKSWWVGGLVLAWSSLLWPPSEHRHSPLGFGTHERAGLGRDAQGHDAIGHRAGAAR